MANRKTKILIGLFIITILVLLSFYYGLSVGRSVGAGAGFWAKIGGGVKQGEAEYVKYKVDEAPTGRWNKVDPDNVDEELEKKREAIKNIAVLPYLQGVEPAKGPSNVTVYNKQKAFNGLNLYNSAHKPSATLMDMEGNVIHEWGLGYDDIWPDDNKFDDKGRFHQYFWRKVHLLPNGDLLAIFEGIAIIKIDKNSNLIWENKCRAHHDIYVDKNGDIYTLTKKRSKPHYNPDMNDTNVEDFITVLSPDGETKKKVSLLDCLHKSNYFPLLDIDTGGDIFHTNALQIIDGLNSDASPILKNRLILISLRHLHMIALVDLESERFTWALTGMWKYQHDPVLLDNGNILVFDNRGNIIYSNVFEFNPLTHEIVWEYKGDSKNPFFIKTCGTNQRLANGNTLITESNKGRAFEVTPDKEIVWEFLNPNRAGRKRELIASLFEMVRIDPGELEFIDIDK